MLGDDTSQKRMDDGDIYPIWSLCTLSKQPNKSSTLLMLGILHMTWSEHFYLTGLPWNSFRPFSWWSWCGLLRGFSVSSIEVKKNRRLKLRELSPCFNTSLFKHGDFSSLSAVHFPGGVFVYEMTRHPKKNSRERRAWILMDPNIHRHSDQTPLPRRASGPILLIPR